MKRSIRNDKQRRVRQGERTITDLKVSTSGGLLGDEIGGRRGAESLGSEQEEDELLMPEKSSPSDLLLAKVLAELLLGVDGERNRADLADGEEIGGEGDFGATREVVEGAAGEAEAHGGR